MVDRRTHRVPATAPWHSKIVSHGTKPARDFLANPMNYRIHPHAQEHALLAVLARVGWVAPVVENVRTGHLIDGHLRVQAALDQDEMTPVPYVQVDIDPAQEKIILASFDPLSAMAVPDAPKYDALLADVRDETGLDLLALLDGDPRKAKGKGLRHTTEPCTCCGENCNPRCGCYREGDQ